MQTRNKLLEDLSQLMSNAMGVAQGAKQEAETAFRSMLERWLADRDLVTREEFEAVRLMAVKAREENDALAARLAALEERLAALEAAGRKPAARRRKAASED
ncbi:BMFP domain-containing protein YqiC [Meinhardsimonia xiamenensis]|jgi:BMFP domain-containing protein YqiC|uniref:BMFP domain-containing protein YqiC n=1 Tax=Meinhardsimonia xiamenensis TaxID=990712 RepID=A0A1G8Z8Y3_9RHOB|nr:accessory factor UbiK family protein [Meinhardsimonia xiamenensis]PRX37600.1 BMFP domain-containing protein YqiC [Meinhardsimonia xiamenensis]SDK11443.1 BMFP domain-containing protein YqiC [Meinhardsimonia xiamenensis]